MLKIKILCALLAEKLLNEKCKEFFGTPCIYDMSDNIIENMTHNIIDWIWRVIDNITHDILDDWQKYQRWNDTFKDDITHDIKEDMTNYILNNMTQSMIYEITYDIIDYMTNHSVDTMTPNIMYDFRWSTNKE